MFHNPEGVALQEVDHLFSYCPVVSGYQIPSLSVHYAVDQRLCNLRPVSGHVL